MMEGICFFLGRTMHKRACFRRIPQNYGPMLSHRDAGATPGSDGRLLARRRLNSLVSAGCFF
ncbi:MAG: hypothetical protein WBV33_11190, partial [Terracidiphilus sp.]